MVFPENRLILEHTNGAQLQFNALDALKLVDAHHESVKVAAAQEWKSARQVDLINWAWFNTQ